MKIGMNDVSREVLAEHFERILSEMQAGLEDILKSVYVDGLNRAFSDLGLEAVWDDSLCTYRVIYR